MATVSKTFSVRNGLDVANTIVLDANRNISNVVGLNVSTANATTVNATTFVTSAGLNVTDQANNAYGQANDAYGQANSAYGQANTAANTVSVTVGSYTLNNKKLVIQNTSSMTVELFSENGNANLVFTSSGGVAYDQANSARDQANTARDTANDAYGQANSARDQANTAYGQANAAYLQANNAYAEANLKLNIAGGTITGSLNVANITKSNAFVSTSQNTVPPNLANTDGERLRLYDFDTAGRPNYAIGVEGNHIWMGVDDDGGTTGFKWYGNTTQAALLRTNGTFEVSNTIVAKNFITTAGLNVTDQANAAYAQANAAYGQANDAYGQANTARGTANDSYAQANTARGTANDAYAQANSAYDTANGAYGQANGAYAQANGAYGQANGAYGQANGAYGQANGAYAQANDAYGQANGAYGQANGAYAQANIAANTVRVYANSAGELSNKFLNFVNTSTITVQVSEDGSNANIGFTAVGGAAYDQANAAYNQANNAYAEANLKLNLTGGTINGTLNVSGNLFVTGNTTFINVATFAVDDSLLYLAANNDQSDIVDIGFVGSKNSGASVTHTGLARDAGDGTWYLFDNLADSGHQNNVIDFANTTLAVLRANINANSILLNGNAVATQANLTLAHDQANTARDTANDAYAQANSGYGQANAAYGQANAAYGQANDAYAQANSGYNQANAAYGQANTAYGQANDAYAQANSAYAAANNRVLKSGDTMTGNLTITTTGTGLSVGNAEVTSHLTIGSLNVKTNTVTTVSSGQVVLDTFAVTAHASAKYFVQANSGTDYTVTEVVVVQDGTNIFLTEYGTIQSGPSLGIFSADIDSGNARLLFTANNNVNTIRSVRYGVLVP